MTERNPDNLAADLSAYLDGELDESRQREVERLLAESADARRMLGELRTVADQLARLPRLHAPTSLIVRLADRAESHLHTPIQASRRRLRTLRLFAQLTAAAAAVAACVFIGYEIRDYSERATKQVSLNSTRAQPAKEAPLDALAAIPPHRAARDDLRPESPPDDKDKEAVLAKAPAEPVGKPTPVIAADSVADTLAYSTEAAPTATPLPVDAPSVNIIVATRTEQEYLRTAVLLADWNARRTPPQDELQIAAAPKKIETAYQLDVVELPTRIDQLARNVAAPDQVQVQMSFDAGRANILAQRSQVPAPTAAKLSQAFDESNVLRTETKSAPVRGGAGTYAVQAKAAEPPRGDPTLMGSNVAAPEVNAPAASLSPSSGPKGESGTVMRRNAVREQPAAAAGGGRGGALAGRLEDRRDEETKARELHERHAEATAEPELPIVWVDPPGSQPAARRIAEGAGTTRVAASQQIDLATKQIEQAGEGTWAYQLFERLFLRTPAPDMRQFWAYDGDRAARAHDQIALRVTLLPPSAPVETSATTPATAPAPLP